MCTPVGVASEEPEPSWNKNKGRDTSTNTDKGENEPLCHNDQRKREPTRTNAVSTKTATTATTQDNDKAPSGLSAAAGFTSRWILYLRDALCLGAFVLVLVPGFVRFAWYYFVTARGTSRRYGTESHRQSVDVYYDCSSSSSSSSSSLCGRSNHSEHKVSWWWWWSSRHPTRTDNDQDEKDDTSQHSTTSCSDSTDSFQSHSETTAPSPIRHGRPVVLFFPGGAWMIGHKMWAALTARVLTQFGIVTVVADYRNHPFWLFGSSRQRVPQIPDMVDDVSRAMEWTVTHVAEFGGDPHRMVVVGQSAGGHLLTTALLHQAMAVQKQQQEREQQHPQEESSGSQPELLQPLPGDSSSSSSGPDDSSSPPGGTTRSTSTTTRTTWRPTDLCGIISVSAPYHFAIMEQTFGRHGLDPSVLQAMFQRHAVEAYDPLLLVQRHSQHSQSQRQSQRQQSRQQSRQDGLSLPPIQLWHGAQDATVPWQSAQLFAQALQQQQQQPALDTAVEFCLYPEWTHTDAILEGPLSGCHDFHRDLVQCVQRWTRKKHKSPSTIHQQHQDNDNDNDDTNNNSNNNKKSRGNEGHAILQDDDGDTKEQEYDDENDTVLQWDDNHFILKPMWCPRTLAKLARFLIPF